MVRLRRWSTDRLLVTDQRIVEVSGLIAKRVTSWPYARIHDLGYRRSIPGRLLGYGSLSIETTAPEAPVRVLERVPQPDGFYRDVMEALMEGPMPDMVELDPDEPDEPDEPVARSLVEDAVTGELPRVV